MPMQQFLMRTALLVISCFLPRQDRQRDIDADLKRVHATSAGTTPQASRAKPAERKKNDQSKTLTETDARAPTVVWRRCFG